MNILLASALMIAGALALLDIILLIRLCIYIRHKERYDRDVLAAIKNQGDY